MNIKKKSLFSAVVLTTFLLNTSAFAMETAEGCFSYMNEDAKSLLLKQVAYEQCLQNNTSPTIDKTLSNLALVCIEWLAIIKKTIQEMDVGTPIWNAWYGVVGHEDIYQQFLNVTFVYRPDPQSNEGMVTFPISGQRNPLETTIDLSLCGDIGQSLCVSTGFRKGKKEENDKKLEIWLAPKFMIEKNLTSLASHFRPIMDKWDGVIAPIGIFWTWGGWNTVNAFEYLTNMSLCDISSKNLFDNWRASTDLESNSHPLLEESYQCEKVSFSFFKS